MTTEQQLKTAQGQAAQWQRVATGANERAAKLERERDAALSVVADLQEDLEVMRARYLAANDMLISQMDAEASQALRASSAEARANDANAGQHWRQTHDAKCQELEQTRTELAALQQHVERTGGERLAQVEAGARTMRTQIAAVIDTHPARRAAAEIAARVRNMPLPTIAEVDQNG